MTIPVRQHVFVVMPFGTKQGVDFDAVFQDYIEPALSGHFEVFRADQEERAGDIRPDMFHELLLADLVVAEISLDNPNVWYELGVRHALRKRGVVQIMSGREKLPFDVAPDRTLTYHTKDGRPDPDHLEADRAALRDHVLATATAWHERAISPVYNLLPCLQEPEWKEIREGPTREYWVRWEAWARHLGNAKDRGRAGDLRLLAEEGPARPLRLEGHKAAGAALRSLGQHRLALEEYERALELDSDDLEARRQKGLLLGRLGKRLEAERWLKDLTKDPAASRDAETYSLLGRLHKEAWMDTWRCSDVEADQRRRRAADEEARLRVAAEDYTEAFRLDPGHFYSGINAATLLYLREHLTGESGDTAERAGIEGGVRWAARVAEGHEEQRYWAKATIGELQVLGGTPDDVRRAYRGATAVTRDWFSLDSSRQQLRLLQELEFRPAEVSAGLAVLDEEIARRECEIRWEPEKVFLFSGHMIDRPGRRRQRFPPREETVGVAAAAIGRQLDELEAGPSDLGICGGACGGDLLFAEACLARGLRLELYLHAREEQFLQDSVAFAGPAWVNRFRRVADQAEAGAAPMVVVFSLPDDLGEPPPGRDRFERNNLRELYAALAYGPTRVSFIALWNGEEGDGPGGTVDMIRTVQQHGGTFYHLDTQALWGVED